MAQNLCSPSNIYGEWEHTLFLGLSVQGFSASLGWNEQPTEVIVQLAYDPCSAPATSPKYYWDTELVKQSTLDPDPGFTPKVGLEAEEEYIGMPAFFRVDSSEDNEGFEFSGIIQSIEENSSPQGQTYSVKLVSPQQIVEGVNLIINGYAGGTFSVPNLYNCFGFMESFGDECAQQTLYGVPFGTEAGGWGGSEVNDNGMSWNMILNGFNLLCNATPSMGAAWSPTGARVEFREGSADGYGIIPGGLYYVDVSELPATPDYYRMNGSSVQLLSSISEACRESGYDYYVELCPVIDLTLDAGVAKFIKFRTVNRSVQPNIGELSDFIDGAGGLQSASEGMELRNEITNTFIFGGNTEAVYQNLANDPPNCDETDIIKPFFGTDSTGDIIIPCKDADGFWEFDVETFKLNTQLVHIDLPNTVTISERELLFALGGFDGWFSFEMNAITKGVGYDIGTAIDAASEFGTNLPAGVYNFKHIIDAVGVVPGVASRDTIATIYTKDAALKDNWGRMNEEIKMIFDWLNVFASEYYGKKYAVRVPYTCVTVNDESGKAITTEVPQQDGWPMVDNILGLDTDEVWIEFFRNDSGKYESFCFVDTASSKTFNNLDNGDFGIVNGDAYIRTQVEPQWYYHDFENMLYPCAVITLPDTVGSPGIGDMEEVPENAAALGHMFEFLSGGVVKFSDIEDLQAGVAGVVVNEYLSYYSHMPDGASFGIKSNINVYGPWHAGTKAGQTKSEQQAGLVPWEYNGVAPMNTAAQDLANEGITLWQVAEKGNMTVPGYPTVPLGAEIGAVAGGAFGAGEHLIEGRLSSRDDFDGTLVGGSPETYEWGLFSYTGGPWTGLFGPNITGISVSIAASAVETTYTFNTFSPKFGKFAKFNAERLRNVGKNQIRANKELAARFAYQIQGNIASSMIADKRRRLHLGKRDNVHSPHEAFVGEIKLWEGPSSVEHRRTIVASESMGEVSYELQNQYDTKAFMSLDGLIRPVSMAGGGYLPRFTAPLDDGECQTLQSRGTVMQVYDGTAGAGCTTSAGPFYAGEIDIQKVNQGYLNPFANPAALAVGTEVVTDRSDTPYVGHDIDIVGRHVPAYSGNVPRSGMPMHIAGLDSDNSAYMMDYKDDYRMFALRGPILLQSWGYDTDGKPIPNYKDVEAATSGGNFTNEDLEYRFMDDWLHKPHSWPVGPIDLRWDRARGVWCSPPSPRNIVGQLCADICPGGNANAHIVSSVPTMYDDDGVEIQYPVAKVYDKVQRCYESGDFVIADYDPYECKYWITESRHEEVFPFRVTVCDQSATTRATELSGQLLDCNGGDLGDPVLVNPAYAECDVTNVPSGTEGWLKRCCVDIEGCFAYNLIKMNQPANWVDFQLKGPITESQCSADGIKADTITTLSDKGCDISNGQVVIHIDDCIDCEQLEIRTAGETSETVTLEGKAVYWYSEPSGNCDAADWVWHYQLVEVCGVNDIGNNYTPRITWTGCNNQLQGVENNPYHDLVITTGLRLVANAEHSKKWTIASNISMVKSDVCVHPDLTNLLADVMYYPEGISLGKGLVATTGTASDCNLEIGAGIMIQKVSDACIEPDAELDVPRFTNGFELGKGLMGTEGTSDCETIVQSYAEVGGSDARVETPGTTAQKTTIWTLGKGLHKEWTTPCTTLVEAGIDLICSSTCVESCSVNNGELYNALTVGKGLNVLHTSDGSAILGLNLQIDSNQITELALGDCLELRDVGTCAATLGFAPVGAPAGGSSTVEFCIPSGPGCAGQTITLNFDDCGRFIP